MCYFLYLASPLTLSEVRSMLPMGLTAHLASYPDQQTLKTVHPAAQTVALVLAGQCSCDLVRPRMSKSIDDERHLRERYRSLHTPRPKIIAALDRHRWRDPAVRRRATWPAELSKFVAEHARNAGPTLYYLDFCPDPVAPSIITTAHRVSASAATVMDGRWLGEATPTLITR